MLRNWTQRALAWIQTNGTSSTRPRRGKRRFDAARRGAMIELLESRRLLTNVVAVSVSGGAVTLTDVSGNRVRSGDAFDVSYTGSQFVLTGHNGTVFQYNNQTNATQTISVTGTLSLAMSLNKHGNSVTVTGDGTANLSSLIVNLGDGRQANALTMNKVLTDSATISGGRRDNSVQLNQSTINHDLKVSLGRSASNLLDLESTTVKGNTTNQSRQLVLNHSTLQGTLTDNQPRRKSSIQSTDTTYTGAVAINMGQRGVINMLTSPDGANKFQAALSVTGQSRHPVTINAPTGALTTTVTPTLTNAELNGTAGAAPAITAPTITTQIASTATPTITGTYDATNSTALSVAIAGQTYTLASPQISTSGNNWTLNLTGSPLTSYSNPITVTSSNNAGGSKSTSGTVTNQQAAISAYLTANSLTATKTADGLNYVITTPGTGAGPIHGQHVTANYTGHVLNSDGTLGTEFDSNVDPQFGHVTPFSFTLGTGAVIAGWDEAFALLPVGTVAKLLIPSSLAYGANAQNNIPANSILVFDVTVISAT